MAKILSEKRVAKILDAVKKKRVLVTGDLMLDWYLFGKVERISPEAPVPIFLAEKEEARIGGAGNVAANISALSAQSAVIGFVGDDRNGAQLKSILAEKNVRFFGHEGFPGFQTITKTRVIARNQQLLRLDREQTDCPFPDRTVDEVVKLVAGKLPEFDALIISDYGKGFVNQRFLKETLSLAGRKIVTVDPKVEHFLSYRGVTSLTPNLDEAAAGLKAPRPGTQPEVEELGFRILRKLGSKTLLITQGGAGMTLFQKNSADHIPAVTREVYDVTGAGDTVIAAFTLAVSAGAPYSEAARFATLAAGVVVGKLGTSTATPDEIKQAAAKQ